MLKEGHTISQQAKGMTSSNIEADYQRTAKLHSVGAYLADRARNIGIFGRVYPNMEEAQIIAIARSTTLAMPGSKKC
jgi:hypothetical protein